MSLADVFIARQPIFDRADGVTGYELLFRGGPENRFAAPDVDLASSQGLERAVMSFGFEHLTDGKDAFVNVSQRVLINELYTLLPPKHAVIELLESVDPTDLQVQAACLRLKERGYRLALDDFVYHPRFEGLLRLADFVKIDWQNPESVGQTTLERMARSGAIKLAEKVETKAERVQAAEAGFDLFQGYYFCQPEMRKSRAVSPSQTSHLALLREVGKDDVDFDRVEQIIRKEAGFSLRLLRYLNSAGFGWRYEVETINHALRLLGVRQMRKWVSAVATVELASGKPAELVATGLVRARLAELLAEPAGLGDLELFFAGLLSIMDAVTDQPLATVVDSMKVSPPLAAGLLERKPPFGPVLDLVIAQERGQWDTIESLAAQVGAHPTVVRDAYYSATSWAQDLARAA